MKTKLFLSSLFSFSFYLLSSQVPQGLNYQAIARGADGKEIINTTIQVKISILSDTTGFYGSGSGTYIWEELQSVKTNGMGLFTLTVGSPLAAKVQGSAVSFSSIDWKQKPVYIGTKINNGGWKNMGTSPLWTVPYSMVAGELDGAVDKLEVIGVDPLSDEALFEVKRKDGQTMFAVYNHGVRVYMPLDTLSKARKGGFAIGGFSKAKGTVQDYFIVNPDSIRAYIDTNPGKARKGGFAIGGFDKAKAGNEEYMRVTRDSTRIYINDTPAKALKGGFAIGGFDKAKGGNASFLNVATDASGIINPSQNRILWYPLKNAFLTGKVLIEKTDSVGINSFATGYESKAKGMYSQALGYQAIARGLYSTSIGYQSIAQKDNSFAFGQWAQALNSESYAFGRGAIAKGYRSYAFGSSAVDSAGNTTGVTYAFGDYSFAIGQGSKSIGTGAFTIGLADTARGNYSLAMGYKSSANQAAFAIGYEAKASGYGAISIGYNSNASSGGSMCFGGHLNSSGTWSFAMGYQTTASGHYTTTMGFQTKASGESSTAMGFGTTASGFGSTAVGYQTTASGPYSTTMGWNTKANQYVSFAIGYNTTASAWGATAMGGSTTSSGSYSTAMGAATTASGSYSTALGSGTTASGSGTFAMGYNSIASGQESTAMGNATIASGVWSTAMGYLTNARGNITTSMGLFTKAKPYASLAIGRYNDTTCTIGGDLSWLNSDAVFIIGNGTSDNNRSNAFTVIQNGKTAIGHASPSEMLDVNGNARFRAVSSGTYSSPLNITSDGTLTTSTSDISMKKNIVPISNALKKVLEMTGVYFSWINDKVDSRRLGFIAQEMEKVLPEVVFTNQVDGLKGINYPEITAVLVQAVKEQQKQIESQNERIERLERMIEEMQGSKMTGNSK